jgi:EAL domain-containing protein (putative c-di-GMP-specific phosphodiesterase class I)
MDADPADHPAKGASAPATPADGVAGERLNRLAARAYRPTRVDVEDALRNDWLEVWYQPKVDLQRKRLVGAEALARIRHPELGVLLPKSFLPEITETGLARLTEFVLLDALRTWSMFDEAGFNLRLVVNIPLAALQRLLVAELVAEQRPEARHWPGLILDVTEADVLRDIELASRIAARLRSRGLGVSIDDCGAACSSLSRLREAAFAELKVDGVFVKNCAVDAANQAICRSAIELAHRLGSAAVAEGIESIADLQALQALGCDLGQGVLIAPPLPLRGLLDLLRRERSRPILPHAVADPQPGGPDRTPGVDRVA